jgi:hypothetical protein
VGHFADNEVFPVGCKTSLMVALVVGEDNPDGLWAESPVRGVNIIQMLYGAIIWHHLLMLTKLSPNHRLTAPVAQPRLLIPHPFALGLVFTTTTAHLTPLSKQGGESHALNRRSPERHDQAQLEI